jgi:hypothetical protein
MALFNDEMLRRARTREHTRELWGIGQPFGIESRPAVETKTPKGFSSGFRFGTEKEMWTDSTLTLAISQSIVASLQELGEMTVHCSPKGGERGGGWLRYHLHNSTPDEALAFSTSLEEVLGALSNPRYLISRSSQFMEDTWLSTMMPEVIAKYLRKEVSSIQMYHSVPSLLASTRERADVFQKYWNLYVSPSELTYARSKDGKSLLQYIRQRGLSPNVGMHQKEVYI